MSFSLIIFTVLLFTAVVKQNLRALIFWSIEKWLHAFFFFYLYVYTVVVLQEFLYPGHSPWTIILIFSPTNRAHAGTLFSRTIPCNIHYVMCPYVRWNAELHFRPQAPFLYITTCETFSTQTKVQLWEPAARLLVHAVFTRGLDTSTEPGTMEAQRKKKMV
jgi:hypothetical protein